MGMPGEYTVQFSHEAIVNELRVLAPEERTTTWIQNKAKQCEETIGKTVKTVAVNSTLLPVTADAVIASLPIWKDIPDKWDNSTVESKMQQKLQRIMAQKTQAYNIKKTIQRFHARGNFVDQFRPRQQNLWVSSGSGSRPRV
jgi:hypothetical protein